MTWSFLYLVCLHHTIYIIRFTDLTVFLFVVDQLSNERRRSDSIQGLGMGSACQSGNSSVDATPLSSRSTSPVPSRSASDDEAEDQFEGLANVKDSNKHNDNNRKVIRLSLGQGLDDDPSCSPTPVPQSGDANKKKDRTDNKPSRLRSAGTDNKPASEQNSGAGEVRLRYEQMIALSASVFRQGEGEDSCGSSACSSVSSSINASPATSPLSSPRPDAIPRSPFAPSQPSVVQ